MHPASLFVMWHQTEADCRHLLCAVGSTFWFAVPEKPATQAATVVDEAEVEEQSEEPAKEEEQPEGAAEEEEQPEGPAEDEAQAVTPPPANATVHETAEDLPEVCSLCAQADI